MTSVSTTCSPAPPGLCGQGLPPQHHAGPLRRERMSLAGCNYYVRGKEDLLGLDQERCFTQVWKAHDKPSRLHAIHRSVQAFIRHHVSFFAHHNGRDEGAVARNLTSQREHDSNGATWNLLESILKEAAPEQAPTIVARRPTSSWHE